MPRVSQNFPLLHSLVILCCSCSQISLKRGTLCISFGQHKTKLFENTLSTSTVTWTDELCGMWSYDYDWTKQPCSKPHSHKHKQASGYRWNTNVRSRFHYTILYSQVTQGHPSFLGLLLSCNFSNTQHQHWTANDLSSHNLGRRRWSVLAAQPFLKETII